MNTAISRRQFIIPVIESMINTVHAVRSSEGPPCLDIKTFKFMLNAVFGIGNVKKPAVFLMFHTYTLLQLS
jgi:hypothetical protein